MIYDFSLLFGQFQYISGRKDKNPLLWRTKTFRQFCMPDQMPVFSMYRNYIVWLGQRMDQLDFLLAGMTRHMSILENHVCSLHRQFVDNLRD